MKKSESYIKNLKIESSIDKIENSISDCLDDVERIHAYSNEIDTQLSDLESRVNRLIENTNVSLPKLEHDVNTIEYEEHHNTSACFEKRRYDLDTVVVCITGGIAVLVDFLMVRIPKTTNIIRNNHNINLQGSPITGLLRQIGFDKDGKTSSWVRTLEKYFGVNYDTSVIKREKGFYPKTHRLYSLAHDPSPSGLLWALKDAAAGTMSYISQDGKLKIVSAKREDISKLFLVPIIWIGHIISDIFTKAGVPIPGSCLLRTLQLGTFGEKRRTLGHVIEYMYIEGFDCRHLVTMGIENAVIEIILRIYHALTKPRIEQFARPQALIQADMEMDNRRLHKLRLQAYSIAACGNISKLAVYNFNPLALNLPIWSECLRTALCEYKRHNNSTQLVLDVISQRQEINEKFDEIENKLKDI